MVRQTFSKFGKVIKTILYEKPVSGAWGFYRFVLNRSREENLTYLKHFLFNRLQNQLLSQRGSQPGGQGWQLLICLQDCGMDL